MAHLNAVTRRKLKYLPLDGQAAHGGQALACWNWALTGFGLVQNNPDELFNYVSQGIPYNANVAWLGVAANQQALTTLFNRWGQFAGGAPTQAALTELHQINWEVTRMACEMNGLTPSVGPTPYEVVMHYDETDRQGNLNGPNYTHWWLRIDGGGAGNHRDGLEVFPGAAMLTIRRPEYSPVHNCSVYVRELHQAHVNIINNVLAAVIAGNHLQAVQHAPWVDTNRCAICQGHVTTGITRHHCRCCGRTVCADCSPATRQVLRNGQQPKHKLNQPATNPPHRVCLYCE